MKTNKIALITILVIFTLALATVIHVQQNPTFTHDLNSIQQYYLSGGQPASNEPPIIFLFLNTLSVIIPSLKALLILNALSFALGTLTLYTLIKSITKDYELSIISTLFLFSPLSFLLITYGYTKELLAITITPLAILFLYRAFKTGEKKHQILAGLLVGIIGLTHEITFVTLVTFYLGYLGYSGAQKHKFPTEEIRNTIIVIVIVTVIAGLFYIRETNTIIYAGGEGYEQYPRYYGMYASLEYRNYSDPILFSFTLAGIITVLRNKDQFGYFVIIWLTTNFLLTLGWVGYQDRFEIELLLPMCILSAYTIKQIITLFREKKYYEQCILILIAFTFLSLFLRFTQATPAYRIDPIIYQDFNLLIFPISLISLNLDGFLAVIIKFIIGVPLTVFVWTYVFKGTVNYLYYRIYRKGRRNEDEENKQRSKNAKIL